MLHLVAGACQPVEEVRDDWPAVAEPVCEECAREGREDWVSLRRCLSCGHVGCCDSSPGLHATAHHQATSHPMVRATHQDRVVDQNFIFGKGFPLGAWVAEMRRRHATGELSESQAGQVEELAGWRWNA